MIFPFRCLLFILSLYSVSPYAYPGKEDYVVPNIVHQTYDYQAPNFFFFLSILSVQRFLRPDKHILWVNDEGRFRRAHWESWQRRADPSSWESVLAEMLRNGSVEARLVLFPLHPPDNSSVFASNKAHRSDLMRMQALYEQGGIYLDTDAFALPHRPLHDLRVHDFVLSFDNLVNHDHLAPKRMNNGVLLSSPRATFLRLWREAYSSSFNPSSFDHDSSVVPFRLATSYPDLVHVEWNRLAPVSYGFQTSLLADALTCGLWQPSPPAIWYPRLSKIGKEVVYNFSESVPDEYMYKALTKKSVLHLTMSQVRSAILCFYCHPRAYPDLSSSLL